MLIVYKNTLCKSYKSVKDSILVSSLCSTRYTITKRDIARESTLSMDERKTHLLHISHTKWAGNDPRTSTCCVHRVYVLCIIVNVSSFSFDIKFNYCTPLSSFLHAASPRKERLLRCKLSGARARDGASYKEAPKSARSAGTQQHLPWISACN